MTGCLGIRTMWLIGATYQSTDYCFSKLQHYVIQFVSGFL